MLLHFSEILNKVRGTSYGSSCPVPSPDICYAKHEMSKLTKVAIGSLDLNLMLGDP